MPNFGIYRYNSDNIRFSYGYRRSKFCEGHMFSNAVKIMVFISDVQNYISIKQCKTAGSIHLFKITNTLKAEHEIKNK